MGVDISKTQSTIVFVCHMINICVKCDNYMKLQVNRERQCDLIPIINTGNNVNYVMESKKSNGWQPFCIWSSTSTLIKTPDWFNVDYRVLATYPSSNVFHITLYNFNGDDFYLENVILCVKSHDCNCKALLMGERSTPLHFSYFQKVHIYSTWNEYYLH